MCLIYDIMGNGILQFGRNIRLAFLYIRIVVIATSQRDEEGPDWFTEYHTLSVYSRVFEVRDNSIMINEHDINKQHLHLSIVLSLPSIC